MFESKRKNDIDEIIDIFKCLTDLFFILFADVFCLYIIDVLYFFFIRLFNLRSAKIIKLKVSLMGKNLYYRDLVFHINFM